MRTIYNTRQLGMHLFNPPLNSTSWSQSANRCARDSCPTTQQTSAGRGELREDYALRRCNRWCCHRCCRHIDVHVHAQPDLPQVRKCHMHVGDSLQLGSKDAMPVCRVKTDLTLGSPCASVKDSERTTLNRSASPPSSSMVCCSGPLPHATWATLTNPQTRSTKLYHPPRGSVELTTGVQISRRASSRIRCCWL